MNPDLLLTFFLGINLSGSEFIVKTTAAPPLSRFMFYSLRQMAVMFLKMTE